eukprot:617453-Pelagomonas_calceolata.AAC.1
MSQKHIADKGNVIETFNHVVAACKTDVWNEAATAATCRRSWLAHQAGQASHMLLAWAHHSKLAWQAP